MVKDDAISRQAVLYLVADYDLSMGQVVKGIHVLPSVTPYESVTEFADRCKECGAKYGKLLKQKTGSWIIVNRDGVNMYACSECDNEPLLIGESYPVFKLSDYCPYCGAKMEVKE